MNVGKRCVAQHVAPGAHACVCFAAHAPARCASFAWFDRDRSRGALFGNVDAEDTSHYDPEKLERANDVEVDHLSERAKHLKQARASGRTLLCLGGPLTHKHTFRLVQVTLGIQSEVDSHLRLLDSLVRALGTVLLAHTLSWWCDAPV
jgi:hypothetical protein